MDLKKAKLKAAQKFGTDLQQELDEKISETEVATPPRKQMTKKEAFLAILNNIKELFLTPFRKR